MNPTKKKAIEKFINEELKGIVADVKAEATVQARAKAVSPECAAEVAKLRTAGATVTEIERAITKHAVSRHTGTGTGTGRTCRDLETVDDDVFMRSMTGHMMHRATDFDLVPGEPVRRSVPTPAVTARNPAEVDDDAFVRTFTGGPLLNMATDA